MCYLRACRPRQNTSVTIALFTLCVLSDRSILRGGQYELTLAFSFFDRGTDDPLSEFCLDFFEPSVRCEAVSDSDDFESRDC